MGTWGDALFDDDVACDVRACYRELVEDGVDDDPAVARVLGLYAATLTDGDEGPVVMLALAVAASSLGRLTPELRDQAVDLLDAGRGLERYDDDPKLLSRRKTALAKVRAQLVGPQPPRRRVRPRGRHVTSLQPGEVLGFELRDRDYVALRVMRLDDARDGVAPVMQIIDWRGEHLPAVTEVEKCRDLAPRPLVPGARNRWWKTRTACLGRRGHDYDDLGFVALGAIERRPRDDLVSWGSYGSWDGLASRMRAWAAED